MSARDGSPLTLEPLIAALVKLLLGGQTTASTSPASTPRSTPGQADVRIDAFASRSGASAFNLGPKPADVRAEFAQRLKDLVAHPHHFDQRQLNACGSAAFFFVWLTRDPDAAAKYAIDLFEHGRGSIGSLEIKASPELLAQSYKCMQARNGAANTPPSPDWVMMSALRDGTRPFPRFLGIPDDTDLNNKTGFVHPQELCDWLKATGLYLDVLNNTNVFGQQNFDNFKNPPPDGTRDVILLMHARMLQSPNLVADSCCKCESLVGTLKPLQSFLAMVTPDHYVVLQDQVQVRDKGTKVYLDFWCWADAYAPLALMKPDHTPVTDSLGNRCMCMPYKVDLKTFTDNFYGAVIAVR